MHRTTKRRLLAAVMVALPLLTAFIAPVFVTRTLTITSLAPSSGVPITVWTADTGGLKNGTTTFARTYNEGAVMSMTAPLITGNRVFSHWEGDEMVLSSNRTVSLRMLEDRTVTAVYGPIRTLTVTSFNPTTGVPITVYQPDLNGLKNGTTTFTRDYKHGVTVSLNAPAIVGTTGHFERWNKDGAPLTTSRTTSVVLTQNTTLSAVYRTGALLTVSSQNPDSGVPITVYQADVAALKNGTTTFTRLYPVGTTVSMTAPAMAEGKTFVRWEKDGVPVSGSARTITILMNSARSAKAVYGP